MSNPFTDNQADFTAALTQALFSFASEMAFTSGQMLGNMLKLPFEMLNESLGNSGSGMIPGWSSEGSGTYITEDGIIVLMCT